VKNWVEIAENKVVVQLDGRTDVTLIYPRFLIATLYKADKENLS
jgi:hypothetical protein